MKTVVPIVLSCLHLSLSLTLTLTLSFSFSKSPIVWGLRRSPGHGSLPQTVFSVFSSPIPLPPPPISYSCFSFSSLLKLPLINCFSQDRIYFCYVLWKSSFLEGCDESNNLSLCPQVYHCVDCLELKEIHYVPVHKQLIMQIGKEMGNRNN